MGRGENDGATMGIKKKDNSCEVKERTLRCNVNMGLQKVGLLFLKKIEHLDAHYHPMVD